jgi:hypothetical protein
MYKIHHPHMKYVECENDTCWKSEGDLMKFVTACAQSGYMPIEVLESVETVEAYPSLFA